MRRFTFIQSTLVCALIFGIFPKNSLAQSDSPITPEVQDPNIIYSYPVSTPRRLSGKTLGLCFALAARDLSPISKPSLSLGEASRVPYAQGPEATQYREEYHHLHLAPATSRVWPRLGLQVGVGIWGLDSGWDFLDYLAGYAARKFDFISGNEASLEEWVLNQPYHSITPYQIFAQSLRIHRGNIMTAVLAIHQLLRLEARWWDQERYEWTLTTALAHDPKTSPHSDEVERDFFDRFIDIRGDLRERGEAFYGDHSGTWYRIWGAMLYRLGFIRAKDFDQHWAKDSTVKKSFNLLEKTQSDINDLRSAVAFWGVETQLKNSVGHPEKDLRKLEYDLAGAQSAAWMYQGLRDPSFIENSGVGENFCADNGYLEDN